MSLAPAATANLSPRTALAPLPLPYRLHDRFIQGEPDLDGPANIFMVADIYDDGRCGGPLLYCTGEETFTVGYLEDVAPAALAAAGWHLIGRPAAG